MTGKYGKLEIEKIIPYSLPKSRCCVEVKRTYMQDGEKRTKMIVCDIRLNHDYEGGRFIQKKSPVTGEPWDYESFDFETPVCSIVARNGIGPFVEEEFKKMFQEQRQREGW